MACLNMQCVVCDFWRSDNISLESCPKCGNKLIIDFDEWRDHGEEEQEEDVRE